METTNKSHCCLDTSAVNAFVKNSEIHFVIFEANALCHKGNDCFNRGLVVGILLHKCVRNLLESTLIIKAGSVS